MKLIRATLLLFGLLVLCASSAFAQWSNIDRLDSTTRPVWYEATITASDIATSVTLAANTGDNVVDNYDISSGTAVSAGSIVQPIVPRQLGGMVVDAASTTLTGTIEITGKNQNGLPCYDKINLVSGSSYFLTKNAYLTIDSISYTLTNNTTNDKLRIGTVGWGIPRSNMTDPQVVVHYDEGTPTSSARLASTTWYFDPDSQVLRANKETGSAFPTIAAGDKIQVFGISDKRYEPGRGFTTASSATYNF